MGRVIDVNYKQLYDLGVKFQEQGEKLKNLRDNSKVNFDTIESSWVGDASFNYLNNSIDIINALYGESMYMLKWAEFFIKASYVYSNNVEEGKKRLESIKNMLDEYEIKKLNGEVIQ